MLKKVLRRLGNHNAIYDDDYYDRDVEAIASQAAPHIADTIIAAFKPSSLIDVGCGTGAMMAAFAARGVSVTGVDYSEAAVRRCKERGMSVQRMNIGGPVSPAVALDHSDVALSLEVAEHIAENRAQTYVSRLCLLAPIVVFSAAAPGQKGAGHINLKPRPYWIEKFQRSGHSLDEVATDTIRAMWQSARIAHYYHHNLMIFKRTAVRYLHQQSP